ncbi:MAG: N-acetylneuraminate synthase family protein [Acidimicrobiales bacterium]|nr:N-acetylneuraminate synthase family protein [Acidimicrobiales bacterium]
MTTIAAALARPPGPLLVAEVAQAHDGSLGTAHAYIDAVARAGAGAVKFQTHLAHAESTPAEPWRVPFSPQDATRYDYWTRMEFTADQWAGLARHAREAGLAFVGSPFSRDAVDLLVDVGADALKVASGEVPHDDLVDACAGAGVPVLLSSGMSPLAELDAAVSRVAATGVPHAVLQCTSRYPCPPEEVGLNLLDEFRRRWGCEVGLSDHSGTVFPGLAAVALGADVVEVHVTLSREAFGPDVTSSVTTAELRLLADGIRSVATMLAHPVDKDDSAAERGNLRTMFTRSLVAARDLPAGHVLEPDDLVAKKPGGGIGPEARSALVGRCLARALVADQALVDDDLTPAAPR